MDTTLALEILGVSDADDLVCVTRARTYKQYLMMVDYALNKTCPFCKVNPATNKVIVETDYWMAWQSPAPEKNTLHHFIIVPKRHILDTESLTDAEYLELREVKKELRRMHGYKYRGELVRDGDARFLAGTLAHLHIHIMVPDGKGRVETPFHKDIDRSSQEDALRRAIIYEKMRRGTAYDRLPENEKLLVKDRLS